MLSMNMKSVLSTAALLGVCASATLADVVVTDAYARSSNAKAGAAFMVIENTGDAADHLLEVRSEAAARVELHTHRMSADGVMSMVHVEDGFALAPGKTLVLERGGDHVMFMGLTAPWADGDSVAVTLVFEQAGAVEIEVPVDLSR